MNIDDLIALAAEQPTRISRRSGVSRSTLKRVGDGTSEPTLSTLREVALALGLDIDVHARPASDPFVATAARTLIDSSVPENPDHAEVAEWLARFERWGIDDPVTLVTEAGILQGLPQREGVQFFRVTDQLGIGALPELLGQRGWALSGAAAATVILGQHIAGKTVVWHRGKRLDGHFERTDSAQDADIIALPVLGAELRGTVTYGPLRLVAPVQLVIDLHSLGLYDAAGLLTKGWEE